MLKAILTPRMPTLQTLLPGRQHIATALAAFPGLVRQWHNQGFLTPNNRCWMAVDGVDIDRWGSGNAVHCGNLFGECFRSKCFRSEWSVFRSKCFCSKFYAFPFDVCFCPGVQGAFISSCGVDWIYLAGHGFVPWCLVFVHHGTCLAVAQLTICQVGHFVEISASWPMYLCEPLDQYVGIKFRAWCPGQHAQLGHEWSSSLEPNTAIYASFPPPPHKKNNDCRLLLRVPFSGCWPRHRANTSIHVFL